MTSMRSLHGVSARYPALRYQMRTVFWGPLLVGAAAMYFFAAIPQSREVYIGIIEDPRAIFQGLLGLLLIGLMCALLDCWQVMLGSAAIDRMYLEHADIHIDKRLLKLRDILSRTSAYFPLGGLLAGLIIVSIEAHSAGLRFNGELERIAGTTEWQTMFPEFSDTTANLKWFPAFVAAGLGIVLAIVFLSRRYRHWRRERLERRQFSPRTLIVWAGVIVTAGVIAVPLAAPDYVVGVTQAAGPLASAAIAMIALVTILMGLSYLSSRLRWPIMGAFVLLLLVWMVWKTTGALAPLSDRVTPGAATAPPRYTSDELLGLFDQWLLKRREANGKAFDDAKVPYPVFIVSAQGGGIYAAAASSAFLASMQDRCPHFAQHVFAISGVSGGAVGSALFAASVPPTLVPTASCGEFNRLAREGTMSVITRSIIRKDHLSPALALVWPDIARKLVFMPDASFDRSSVLERSFACAFTDPKSAWSFHCPPATGEEAGLRMPFEKHWSIDRATPALVLAGTWAETGLRTAFAPFPLHAVGDGTLDSFYRSTNRQDDFALQGVIFDPEGSKRSLIEAAFVSARFPGIVPAWQAKATFINGGKPKTWNFVDGGYVDNSGASTALDLYKALAKHIREQNLGVSLYLIMLTDANTNPKLEKVEDGTPFSDVVAPLTALLNVRGQLAYRAVTRAIGEVEPGGVTADQLAGRTGHSKVLAVNLQQETFKLPLGWKISRITDDIVRLMLGRPMFCEETAVETTGPGDIRGVIGDNSCVKKRLEDLLQAKAIP